LKEQTHQYDFKGAQILVAEDNDINAELIVKLLERANCKVEESNQWAGGLREIWHSQGRLL